MSGDREAAFRTALTDVGGEITEAEAQTLAFQCTAIKRGERAKITSGAKLVEELQRVGFVTAENVDPFIELLKKQHLNDALKALKEYKTKYLSGTPATQGPTVEPAATAQTSHVQASDDIFEKPVESEDLKEVSGKVTAIWKDIGRNLKMDEDDFEAILQDHRGNIRETSHQMFLAWSRKGTAKATYKILGDALIKAGRTDVQEAMYKRVRNSFSEKLVTEEEGCS